MKLITRDTDYAIRALSCIAASGKRAVSVNDLAKELAIPRPFLRKILQALNRENLLKSYKGKGGGFRLVADPAKVTVFDIIEIFQGPFRLNEHLFKGRMCPRIKGCKLKKRIDSIEGQVIKELKNITITSCL